MTGIVGLGTLHYNHTWRNGRDGKNNDFIHTIKCFMDTRDCTKRLFIGLDGGGGHEVGPSVVHSYNAVNCAARKIIVSPSQF